MPVPTKLATVLGERYSGVSHIGGGCQGQVYRAHDAQRGGAAVALKWIEGKAQRSQAVQEFSHLATLVHPSLTRVLGIEEGEAGICLVSEFIDGESMADFWAGIAVSDRVAVLLNIASALARALGHLHAQGLAHGDIKPDNLIFPAVGDPPVVLLDLGLARSMGAGDCRGTPAYMAPEALSGHLDGRTDIYSLGLSLIEMFAGEPVIRGDTTELGMAILGGGVAKSREVLKGLPTPLIDLLLSMIAVDRSQRPSGATALQAHITRVAEACGVLLTPSDDLPLRLLHAEFFGRQDEVEALVQGICRHTRGDSPAGIIEVVGPPGSGRSRLIREALLRAQVRLARSAALCPEIRHVAPPATWTERIPDALSFLLASTEDTEGPCILVCEQVEAAALCDLQAADIPDGILVIVEGAEGPWMGPGAIPLPPLSPQECEELCQSLSAHTVPADWAHRAGELARHRPGPLIELMKAASALDPAFQHKPDLLFLDEELSASLLARVKRLSKGAGRLLEVLAVARGQLSWLRAAQLLGSDAAELIDPAREGIAAGLVSPENGELRCTSERQARIIDAHLPVVRRKAVHRLFLQEGEALTLAERARHLLVAGPLSEAAEVSLAAIKEAQHAGRLSLALELCIESTTAMRGQNISEHAALAAEIALTTGDYDLAEEYASKARRSRDPEFRERGLHSVAQCARHRGDVRGASIALRDLVRSNSTSSKARAALAKNLLAEGAIGDALAEATAARELASAPEEEFAAAEIAGLAHLYLGDLAACDAQFARLENFAKAAASERLRARAMGLRAMAMQKHSQLLGAAELYGEAATLSHSSGAIHAGAVFLLNQATVLQRLARYSDALHCYQEAHRGLVHGRTPFELCAAHCNRGNLLLTLGEIASARKQAVEAERLALQAQDPRMSFFVHILLGEVCERERHFETALRHYEDALAIADQHGLADRVYAVMRLAEHLALASGAGALQYVSLLESASEEHQGEIDACRARVALAMGTPTKDAARELGSALARAQSENNLDLAWKLAALRARTLAALGMRAEQDAAAEVAESIFATVLSQCPEAYRIGLRRHPDAEAMLTLTSQDRAASAEFGGPPLRRLLALSRRLNSEHRIEPLLDEIIDTAVELSRAERAFLLLRDRDGVLRFRVARNMDRKDLDSQQELSLSIAERVASTGQVVMTVDAEADQRFGASQSVAALQLRSILAVPFRVKQRVVGTLYLDHRFRRSAFDDNAIEVVRELADIAAVAIENARLTRDNLRRQEEIRALNRQLEERLESTEVELAQTRAQVPLARPAGAFSEIKGSSKPMRELLANAERAARCELSVVIGGESGTGKELLARAIHNCSSRRGQAFVPINCGAVPDSLLEAELFGYKRGAFTGADRGKRGLFEVADHGTLFLDEIADTSLSMQSKLLRALQEGEIRPLGAEDVRHVDIRVICASNKSLWDEVVAGRFREDLYYRLKVLELQIPPLRERRGDIPELAAHLLAAQPGTACSLDPSSIRLLQSHDWPGNVRELENEIARASAMSEGEVIQATHFSQALQDNTAIDIVGIAADSLEIKPQVEALERGLVETAMQKTGNNQSKAAVLLGLSRYGLQKKLQRYGIVGSQQSSTKD